MLIGAEFAAKPSDALAAQPAAASSTRTSTCQQTARTATMQKRDNLRCDAGTSVKKCRHEKV